ncbi:hypothetical protein SESBI_15005 [Sesbania bispinosa]|nr:hypothetical protein SESBI_15005 [Sesbania bispinosa]
MQGQTHSDIEGTVAAQNSIVAQANTAATSIAVQANPAATQATQANPAATQANTAQANPAATQATQAFLVATQANTVAQGTPQVQQTYLATPPNSMHNSLTQQLPPQPSQGTINAASQGTRERLMKFIPTPRGPSTKPK